MTENYNEKFVTVGEYDDPTAVEFIKAKSILLDNNIKFTIEGEDGYVGSYGGQHFRIKLKVNQINFNNAKNMIGDLNINKGKGFPSFCPKCDSENIVEKDCFVILPIFGTKKYQCENCRYSWKPDRI